MHETLFTKYKIHYIYMYNLNVRTSMHGHFSRLAWQLLAADITESKTAVFELDVIGCDIGL